MEYVEELTQPSQTAAAQPSGTGEQAAPVEIDINSLDLADEELHLDPNADAFGFAAPPSEKGNPYRAKLSKSGSWKKATAKKTKAEYYTVGITAQIISDDPKLNDRKIPDMPEPSTLVMDSTGTCRIQGIVQELSSERIGNIGRVALARKLDGLLAGGPIVGIVVQWEGYCSCTAKADGSGGVRVRGEQRFPERLNEEGQPTGERIPKAPCPKCGNDIDARARIIRYKRL